MALTDKAARAERAPLAASTRVRVPWGKRAFDVAVSLPLCVVALPVVVLLAALLAVLHRGNPFFVHYRIGQAGRLVLIPKLRTLSSDTPRYADKTVVHFEALSSLARFLRRRHLDELPQLFLVPTGRLSLVGPRPRMASEAEDHADEGYEAIRTSVHQGCTGLWQISGSTGRVSDHPGYDLFYVEQRTLRLDAWILWHTARRMLGGPSVDLADVPAWALRWPELAFGDAA